MQPLASTDYWPLALVGRGFQQSPPFVLRKHRCVRYPLSKLAYLLGRAFASQVAMHHLNTHMLMKEAIYSSMLAMKEAINSSMLAVRITHDA